MPAGGVLFTVAVATARAVIVLMLSLAFWAAAPTALGWMPTTVMTASMTPAIEVGDVVVSRPLPRDTLVRGRVVLAIDPDWPDRLRLHRVTDVNDGGLLVTKGDANPAADSSPLHPDAVQGVGVLRVPWIGLPAVWVRSGAILPLSLSALAFVSCLALALRRADDDDDDPANRPPPPPHVNADASPPLTRRALRAGRRLSRRDPVAAPLATIAGHRRLFRGALPLAVIVGLALGAGTAPAWAGIAASTTTTMTIRADRVSPPTSLACSSRFLQGVWVSWRYEGPEPRSFDVLVDGRVAATGIPATAREVRVPNGATWGLLRTSAVTVRTNLGAKWHADAAQSVAVGSLLGVPYCA